MPEIAPLDRCGANVFTGMWRRTEEICAMAGNRDFRKMLEGYGLTTALILYRRPDHLSLLQEYVWQDYDLFPNFPGLAAFLRFWETELVGPLHSVRVAHARLIKPAEIRPIDGEYRLN